MRIHQLARAARAEYNLAFRSPGGRSERLAEFLPSRRRRIARIARERQVDDTRAGVCPAGAIQEEDQPASAARTCAAVEERQFVELSRP